MDGADLAALSRKQIQQIAKQNGIKANLKTTEVIAKLLALRSAPAEASPGKEGQPEAVTVAVDAVLSTTATEQHQSSEDVEPTEETNDTSDEVMEKEVAVLTAEEKATGTEEDGMSAAAGQVPEALPDPAVGEAAMVEEGSTSTRTQAKAASMVTDVEMRAAPGSATPAVVADEEETWGAVASESEPVDPCEPEPVAATEPEPIAATEPEPVAAAKPEPIAAAEPEPIAATEPESVAATEPEPVAATESEPIAAADSEPVAAADVTSDAGAVAAPDVDMAACDADNDTLATALTNALTTTAAAGVEAELEAAPELLPMVSQAVDVTETDPVPTAVVESEWAAPPSAKRTKQSVAPSPRALDKQPWLASPFVPKHSTKPLTIPEPFDVSERVMASPERAPGSDRGHWAFPRSAIKSFASASKKRERDSEREMASAARRQTMSGRRATITGRFLEDQEARAEQARTREEELFMREEVSEKENQARAREHALAVAAARQRAADDEKAAVHKLHLDASCPSSANARQTVAMAAVHTD